MRPSDEALAAFLAGNATADQEVQILMLLEISRDFRHEVAEVASDIARLRDSSGRTPTDRATEDLPQAVLSKIEKLPTGKFRRIKGVAALLAAAILVVASVLLLVPSGDEFTLVTESIERSALIPMTTRGTVSAPKHVQNTPEEAALFAFRNALVYENAGFVPLHGESKPFVHDVSDSWSLGINYRLTGSTYLIRFPVPTEMEPGGSASYYLLTLPNRNLYKLSTSSNDVTADWILGPADLICVALVYPRGGGYSASSAQIVPTQ